MSTVMVRRCVRSGLTRALLRPVQRDYVPGVENARGRFRFFADKAGGKNDDAMRGLPESRVPIVEDQSIPATEEEFVRRRAAKHGVKIQGGSDEAKAFVEELIEWKASGVVSGIGPSEEK